MLAARLHAFGQDPRIEDVPEPSRPPNTTLIDVTAAAVAHLDFTVASGRFALRPQLPFTPGAEGAGYVLESDRFAPGTLVRVRGAGVGVDRHGLWAQRAAVPDEAVLEVRRGCDPLLAATYFSPAVTAQAAVEVVGSVRERERVAIVGAGGVVGRLAAQLAARRRPRELLAVDVSSSRLGDLPTQATAIVSSEPGWMDVLAHGGGVDVLIDFAGGEQLAQLIGGVMRPGGRAVLVGYVAGTDVTFHLPNLIDADVCLLPVNLMHRGGDLEDAARWLLDELCAGRLKLPIAEYPLADLPRALRDLTSRRAGERVVLLCNPEAKGN